MQGGVFYIISERETSISGQVDIEYIYPNILKLKWFCRKTNILVRFCGEQECSPYRTNLIEYNSKKHAQYVFEVKYLAKAA